MFCQKPSKRPKTGRKQGFEESPVLRPLLVKKSQPADFVTAMATKKQAADPWTTVACPDAMVEVRGVEPLS